MLYSTTASLPTECVMIILFDWYIKIVIIWIMKKYNPKLRMFFTKDLSKHFNLGAIRLYGPINKRIDAIINTTTGISDTIVPRVSSEVLSKILTHTNTPSKENNCPVVDTKLDMAGFCNARRIEFSRLRIKCKPNERNTIATSVLSSLLGMLGAFRMEFQDKKFKAKARNTVINKIMTIDRAP